MELLGIFLSVPVALVISALYSLLAEKIVKKSKPACSFFRILSAIVLATFLAEVVMLIFLGTIRSHNILGSSFYTIHLIIFFLGSPALANILILRNNGFRWYTAAALCTVFAFCLVLLQYSVSESLFGIE
jgi:hypothetical protein